MPDRRRAADTLVVTFEFGHLLDPVETGCAPVGSRRHQLPDPQLATRVELPPPGRLEPFSEPVPVCEPEPVIEAELAGEPGLSVEPSATVGPVPADPVVSSRFAAGGLDDDRLPTRRRRR